MITKPFFQDVDDFGRVILACGEVVYQDYLGIEISKDEVIHTIQCEDVQCTYLPGTWRCRCWYEWYSSILSLKSHACFMLLNSFLNGLVDTRPENTITGKQVCFGNALVWLVQSTKNLLPLWWRDDEGFPMEHKSIFNGGWLTVLPVGM